MRVLVTAASKHAATAEIAAAIGRAFAERGVDARVVDPGEVTDLSGYDAVVLGSAVYAGRWLEEAKTLVERLRGELGTRPVWLFSSGPVGDPPKPVEDPADVAAIMAATGARQHRVFAGKLDKQELSFGERAVVKVVRAPEGDYRDWPAVTAWASEIADVLQDDVPAA